MDVQNPKIIFYARRSFGDKINATFDFIKENWKVMMKYITYIMLPLCLLQAMSMAPFMNAYISMSMSGDIQNLFATLFTPEILIPYVLTLLLGMLGGLLVGSLVFALIQAYNERENGLANITLGELKSSIFRNMGRLFLMGFVIIIFYSIMLLVVGILASVTLFTLLLTIPCLFVALVALSLAFPIYIFEKIDLFSAIGKAFRLGIATWGGVFGIFFIMSLLAAILQGVVSTPYTIALVVKTLLTLEGGSEGISSVGYTFFMYIVSVIAIFGSYLTSLLYIIGLSYQYSHASEKMDSITVESEIDNFEQI